MTKTVTIYCDGSRLGHDARGASKTTPHPREDALAVLVSVDTDAGESWRGAGGTHGWRDIVEGEWGESEPGVYAQEGHVTHVIECPRCLQSVKRGEWRLYQQLTAATAALPPTSPGAWAFPLHLLA